MINSDQAYWIDMMKMILQAKPDFESIPLHPARSYVYKIITNDIFDICIMTCIVLNMFQMGMQYEGQGEAYTDGLEFVNQIFTFIFAAEAVAKIFALGSAYFKNSWNQFDFMVVIASLADIVLSQLQGEQFKFLTVGPQLARVLRVVRVSRLFRLINKYKDLQALI